MVLPKKFVNSIVVVIDGKLKIRPNINHINLFNICLWCNCNVSEAGYYIPDSGSGFSTLTTIFDTFCSTRGFGQKQDIDTLINFGSRKCLL